MTLITMFIFIKLVKNKMQIKHLIALVAICSLSSVLAVYSITSIHSNENKMQTSLLQGGITDAPIPMDLVTVTIHDKNGNLVSQQTTYNIITTAGAAFYCIQSGICLGGATGAIQNPTVNIQAAAPTYWVGFINGTTTNTNEPTAADCSVSSSNQLTGETTGSGAATKCVISFGSAPAQYPSDANTFVATTCVNAGSCVGDLRASAGTVEAATSYTLTTRSFNGCSPNANGTAPSSGTCVNAVQTSVFTNNVSQKLNIIGLALVGGGTSAVASGPIVVAEAKLSPVVLLNSGDTIQVTWQITI